MKDFTLNKYRKLLESLISNNINIYGINDYLKTKPKKGVLIRHDVDRNPNNALEMAKLENALNSIRLHKIYKKYGMPNDMLVKLNIAFCTIKEVEIKPVYNIGEKSKMKIFKVIPRISWLLFKSFFKRLWVKYLFRDFHPLFLLYNMAFFLFVINIPFLIHIIKKVLTPGSAIISNNLVIFVFLFISAFQSLLFAMWMDIQDNERLYK